ncbi:MAG: V-type ATP synthase subunit F [Aerococcus sp.]|nr:V-type ATP synthase subunit F [Aerococcus sp.]
MKSFVLTDHVRTLTGLRLAGVPGEYVTDKEQFTQTFQKVIADSSIGILMISPDLIEQNQEMVDDVRFNRSQPLIVEAPEDQQENTASIAEIIQKAIGLSL